MHKQDRIAYRDGTGIRWVPLRGAHPMFPFEYRAVKELFDKVDACVQQTRAYWEHLSRTGNVYSTSSWTPEVYEEAQSSPRGRSNGPEWITIHPYYRVPELLTALEAAGLAPSIRVYKNTLDPSDVWKTMSLEEKLDRLEGIAASDGWLSASGVRFLVRHGRWTHERALHYHERYETENPNDALD